jgi:iron complex outermembrane receptor protein
LSFQSINGTLALPVIRGLAQTNITGSENNVSSFINGIYLSNNRALDVALVDLERIEVIKGPQSAIYGRNSFAGAISYVTAKPSDEFEAYAMGTLGDDELYEAKVSVTGPIVEDKLNGRLALMASGFDGNFKNAVSSDNLQGFDGIGVHGALDWQVTDDFDANLFVYYADQDNDQPARVLNEPNCGVGPVFAPGPTYFCGTVPVPSSFSLSPDAFGLESENTIVGLDLNWRLNDNWSIVSLTGWSESTSASYLDFDGSGVGVPFAINGGTGTVITNTYLGQGQTEVEDLSQELRLAYTAEGWSGSLGLYYYDSDRSDESIAGVDSSPLGPGDSFDSFIAALFATPDPINSPIISNQTLATIETIAVFGEASWQATDKLELSGELRYTDEEKTINRISVFGSPPSSGIQGEQAASFDFLTFRAIASFQATDDLLYYFSIASGARAGGFNAAASTPAEQSFDEETNTTFELGAKTEWLDKRLVLNGAIYYVDWTDLQIAAPASGNIGSFVTNSGDASSVGLELELNAFVTDNFSVGVGYAYTNPEFDDGAIDNSLSSFCGTDDSICQRDSNGNVLVGGNQLGRTHQHQFNASAQYSGSLTGDWDWYARADVAYVDEQPVRAENVQFIDAYSIANARLGLTSERFEVALWAKNLFDEGYLTAVSTQPNFDGVRYTDTTMGLGRTWGLTGRINFGGAGR